LRGKRGDKTPRFALGKNMPLFQSLFSSLPNLGRFGNAFDDGRDFFGGTIGPRSPGEFPQRRFEHFLPMPNGFSILGPPQSRLSQLAAR
jgi:hypothetical protein